MSTFDDSDFDDIDDEEWDEDLEETTPMSVGEWFWDIFITWGPAIFMVFFIRSSIAEPFRIPSGSMVPTLQIGDHILVTKFSYGWRVPLTRIPIGAPKVPERGDVVVFVKPNPGQDDFVKQFDFPFPPFFTRDFVKRVVGLPGDKIKVKNNVVFINGVAQVKEKESDYKFVNQNCYSKNTVEYIETMNNRPHHILNNSQYASRFSDFAEFTVPEGEVFMMGDNRDNSSDSRDWGTVPLRNIKGKAQWIWQSLETCNSQSVFREVRGERFGLAVE